MNYVYCERNFIIINLPYGTNLILVTTVIEKYGQRTRASRLHAVVIFSFFPCKEDKYENKIKFSRRSLSI